MCIKLKVVSDLTCPKCGAEETKEDGSLNIRAFKVEHSGHWWSQCLVCAKGDPKKGWF